MDPNQAVKDINAIIDTWLSSDEASALLESMDSLFAWLEHGGFVPAEQLAHADMFKRYRLLQKIVSQRQGV